MSMIYRATLATAPAVEPIDLEEAKRHLRVDSHDEDELILSLITAARMWAEESYTYRAFVNQTWDFKFDYGFPACFDVPKPPLSSVTSITYVDTTGATQTLASSQYTVDAPAGTHAPKGRIVPAYNVSWPSTRSVINAVTMKCVCGYGASAASVPAQIKQGLLLVIGEMYKQREISLVGTSIVEVPFAVKALLGPFRMIDLS